MFFVVSNYVVFDAVVEVVGDYAHFKEIYFCAIGPVTDNAPSPTGRHAGDLEQLIFRGMVDVDSRFGRRRIFGSLWHAGGISVLTRR